MIKSLITEKALELGFSHCGFARCEPLEGLRPFYDSFVLEKRFAAMQYLERYAGQRLNPEVIMPGAKTVISFLMNYYPPGLIPTDDNYIISKYAYGQDYRRLMHERLDILAGFMQSAPGDIRTMVFVDSGPVLEKAWAQRCGTGWQGKNTLVINRSEGSFFFIGILLTDLAVDPDQPETDHCGNCEKCVKACPTGALDTPYQLNIPRCISYLTLEKKEEIPGGLKSKLKDRIYGCDICQDVCPYNRLARAHGIPEFLPPGRLMEMRKRDWISLTEQEFDRLFTGSPVMRLGYSKFMSNIMANRTNEGRKTKDE